MINPRKEFSSRIKERIYLKSNGKCVDCGKIGNGHWDWSQRPEWFSHKTKRFYLFDMEIHHIIPVNNGGKTEDKNLILLCPECHKIRHRKKIS